MLRCAVLCLALAALPHGARANGRAPATSSITFRQDHDSDVAVGLTFGLLISHDSGATWQWICEAAVGYGGTYDPRYAFSSTGALFASTFDGLKVTRDSCAFATTASGAGFIATELLGPDHTLYVAASRPADPGHGVVGDYKIYRSSDDGATFPTSSEPAADVAWWQSLAVAPSDPQRLYLSGYRYSGTGRVQMLFRSDDGGTNWIALPITGLTVGQLSAIDFVGIARGDADHVYLRVEAEDDQIRESIYRSTDKGEHWTPILHKAAPIPAFLVSDNGDLIAGTQSLGAVISHDDGTSWLPLNGAPHMNCLVENAAHEIWACTQNYGTPIVPSDGAGILKTTDLVTWTKVLRYEELTDAAGCAPGTIQRDSCAALWCGVCQQLGCTPSPAYGCNVDAPVDAPLVETPPATKGGCCDGSPGTAGGLALGLAIGTLVLRPRRHLRHPTIRSPRKGT